ncbi:MAG: GNAT family N-acetyltransferase [Spirochaetes bacterium]|jgi:ribosomal-protein-alanine N-acetyltransferase|nr:GNAT family N-acetyltransferase [Spirochaetota bacterium]
MKILETERLVLEELKEDRFEDLANLLVNEKVHTFFPKTLNREESGEYLEIIKKRQKNDGISFWAVIRKDDSKFLGICGLLVQSIDGKDEIEVGYRIDDLFWGKGYGTEAAKGCLKFAKEKLKISSVISLILPENIQSIRVAEKNGLTLQKKSMFHGQMHHVYRINF